MTSLKRTKKKQTTAISPDNICGRMLRYCAEQLGSVFQQLFQRSLNCTAVSSMRKQATVIPAPKKGSIKVLNGLRPVALTSLLMKVLERIVKSHITRTVNPPMDPLQFAYRAGRGVDDAEIYVFMLFLSCQLVSADYFLFIYFWTVTD